MNTGRKARAADRIARFDQAAYVSANIAAPSGRPSGSSSSNGSIRDRSPHGAVERDHLRAALPQPAQRLVDDDAHQPGRLRLGAKRRQRSRRAGTRPAARPRRRHRPSGRHAPRGGAGLVPHDRFECGVVPPVMVRRVRRRSPPPTVSRAGVGDVPPLSRGPPSDGTSSRRAPAVPARRAGPHSGKGRRTSTCSPR